MSKENVELVHIEPPNRAVRCGRLRQKGSAATILQKSRNPLH
jgi:hypothetical protein